FAARMVTGQGEARWASWPYDRSEATWVGRRLARAPVFPSLATVGLALVAYVVVVGVVNFGVLRRRGRPEWAWLTVPALAILFAAAFYAGAARHRPRAFHLDEIALRWMDDRSDVAAIQETLRLSSAGRAAVRLGVPGEAVLTGPRARPEVVQVAALGVQAPTAAAEPPPAGAFALNELLRGWPTDGGRAFEVRRALFLGYGPAGTLNSDVTGTPATRAPHVVTVVSLGRR